MKKNNELIQQVRELEKEIVGLKIENDQLKYKMAFLRDFLKEKNVPEGEGKDG
jgi:regulator of replication initiation timing